MFEMLAPAANVCIIWIIAGRAKPKQAETLNGCDGALATDRVRASSRQHPVQHRHADGRLGLLGSEAAGPQTRSDQIVAR